MTYVTEQTSAELTAHMKRLKAMPGWHDPLSDRLWREVEQQATTIATLAEALASWDDMITNCGGVPQNPDGLPMMLRHAIRRQLAALQAAAR